MLIDIKVICFMEQQKIVTQMISIISDKCSAYFIFKYLFLKTGHGKFYIVDIWKQDHVVWGQRYPVYDHVKKAEGGHLSLLLGQD